MSTIKSRPSRDAHRTTRAEVRTLQLSNLVKVAESPRSKGGTGKAAQFDAGLFENVQGTFKKA
jgi:hypothetical protein